jgi:hypothetical protein
MLALYLSEKTFMQCDELPRGCQYIYIQLPATFVFVFLLVFESSCRSFAVSMPAPAPAPAPAPTWPSSFLSIPGPLKRLFDATPLVTYEENDLPQRSVRPPRRSTRQDIHAFFDAHVREKKESGRKQKEGALHTFFSWASEDDGSNPKVASFNPSCLRWQVRHWHGNASCDGSLTGPCRHT